MVAPGEVGRGVNYPCFGIVPAHVPSTALQKTEPRNTTVNTGVRHWRVGTAAAALLKCEMKELSGALQSNKPVSKSWVYQLELKQVT